MEPDSPRRDQQLRAVAREVVPAWASLMIDEPVDIAPVGGGITNLLFRLETEGRPPLLVRIYGRNTDVVIDRDAENRLLARLSRAGLAPIYHGRFTGGGIEGFCPGTRALEPAEMGDPHLRVLIARELARLHAVPVDDPTPRLWTTLEGWMAAARTVRFNGGDAARHAALDLDGSAEALASLRHRFETQVLPGATSPGAQAAVRAVLAHNDLLSGNVLYHSENDAVRFIDFEYGACSFAAFDLANHFCEYAGFDSDFARGFPRRSVRDDVIGAYLGESASPGDIEDFSAIVDFFVLPDHLWWGTWAVVQARHSPIAFDFMDYARLRLAGFAFHTAQMVGGRLP